MMKKRLLAVVLVILGAAGAVLATEVINVDIKGYNDNTPYVGNGAYDVGANAVWAAYSGGWGVPVGSPRSEALVPSDVPIEQQYLSSVYAAQLWLGDDGLNHGYQYGSGLMDDGFVSDDPCTTEPKLDIFGQGAYQGIYDIYVYGNDAGSFRLYYYGTTTTKTVTGGAPAGTFVEGQNYVVFSNVDLNDASSGSIYLNYTKKLNALQFVKKKSPFVIEPNSLGWIRIPAGDWDVAGERNTRTTELTSFGPDTWFDDVNGIGRIVGYLDSGEFMDYDITVNDANKGQYQISLGILGGGSYAYISAASMYIYLDNRLIGEVNKPSSTPAGTVGETTKVTVNLYPGSHTVGWDFKGYSGTNTGFSLVDVNFVKIGPTVISNCADVVNYGFALTKDLNGNCVVDFEDVALMVDNWLICNDPNGCF
jgi:hypothetical protein